MTTGVYIHVSTVGQNEHGQKREIERWLRGNGLTDARWYIAKASGKSLDRPEFTRLRRDIFHLWKPDRLSRNLHDGLNVLIDWCDRGLRVVSTTQQIDFNSSLGKMLAWPKWSKKRAENAKPPASRRQENVASTTAARSRPTTSDFARIRSRVAFCWRSKSQRYPSRGFRGCCKWLI